MSIDNFLGSTTSLIAAIGALVAAIASLTKAFKDLREQKPPEPPDLQAPKPSTLASLFQMPAFDFGVLLALTSVGIFIARTLSPLPPLVAIINPTIGQQIEVKVLSPSSSGSFFVQGTSSEVFSTSNRRIYILIHSSEPFASGWWIQQPPSVEQNGRWETLAWYGSQEAPPQPGNQIDILAVVANPEVVAGRLQISDPQDINPEIQSDIIKVTIGSIK